VTPDAYRETLHDIMADLLRQGLQRPLVFACIAADGGTMTGSYDCDRRVVVTPPAPAALPLPLHLLVVDPTAKARHVTIARAPLSDELRRCALFPGLHDRDED
jgi:hypothetical protein